MDNTICENLNDIILLVSEDDGFDNYYKLNPITSNILIRVHDKKFGFHSNGVFCDDNSVHMDSEMIHFLRRFRRGRYTSKWSDIAELISVIENVDNSGRCLPYNYCMFLHH